MREIRERERERERERKLNYDDCLKMKHKICGPEKPVNFHKLLNAQLKS